MSRAHDDRRPPARHGPDEATRRSEACLASPTSPQGHRCQSRQGAGRLPLAAHGELRSHDIEASGPGPTRLALMAKEADVVRVSSRVRIGTAPSRLGFVNIDDARSPTLLLDSTPLEAVMGPFKHQKSVVTVIDQEGPGDRREVTSPTKPPKPLGTDHTAVPAGWHPDPVDSTSLRFWDGFVWTRLTKPIPPPATAPVNEALSSPPVEGAVALHPVVDPAETPATNGPSERVDRGTNDALAEREESADHWVKEADKLVVIAQAVGSPLAWRSAAQAAVVVAEIAQTMRVTTHTHQIAQQLAAAAEEAAQDAQAARRAADDAMRTAEHMAQAAEEATRTAQVAVAATLSARQEAAHTAHAAPKAEEDAQRAAQAAATARDRADHLDQIVIKARQSNTSDAWSEALQIATEACRDGDYSHLVSTEERARDTGQDEA